MSTISNIGAKKWAHTIRDIQKKSYWVIGLLLLGFSAYFYYTGLNKPVAGVLWFLGGFLIWYYYWVKWFVMDQPLDPDFNTASGACPDYLSVIPNNSGLYMPTSKTQYFCVDFVGVSRNGGIHRMNPKKVSTQINDPTYRFSVDPEVDFVSAAAKAAFVRRLQAAGLSYNSVGDSSLPMMGTYSNNAPVFTGVPQMPSGLTPMSGSGGAFQITMDQVIAAMIAMFSYAKANNMTWGQSPTEAQKPILMANLVSKGIVPAGVTYDQFEAAGKALGPPTQAQMAQIMAAVT